MSQIVFGGSSSLPRVSVIIVNYGKGWLSKCIASVAATAYPQSRIEIVVVDNASSDDLSSIENWSKEFKLIKLKQNVGFPMAVNIGVDESKGEYVAVLNNDVIVSPDWLSKLVNILECDENVAAVCPRKESLSMKNVLDGCGGALNILGQGWDRGESEFDTGQYSDLDEVIHPPGAAFLTRRKLRDELGFFLNPDFFMLIDDVDFGLRCWKAGYTVVYTPDCIVYHARSPTLGGLNERNLYYYTKNLLASIFEVFDLSTFIRLFPLILETELVQASYLLWFHKKSHAVPSVLRAVKDFLFNLRHYSTRKARVAKTEDKKILQRFTPSLIMFEEGKPHEKYTRLFLSVNNLYIKFVLQAQPIKDITYLRKNPR